MSSLRQHGGQVQQCTPLLLPHFCCALPVPALRIPLFAAASPLLSRRGGPLLPQWTLRSTLRVLRPLTSIPSSCRHPMAGVGGRCRPASTNVRTEVGRGEAQVLDSQRVPSTPCVVSPSMAPPRSVWRRSTAARPAPLRRHLAVSRVRGFQTAFARRPELRIELRPLVWSALFGRCS